MGDAHLHGGVVLNTHSFSIAEVELLINVLTTKFGLICKIRFHREKPLIYISKKSLKLLQVIVKPYFVPSMLYKIGLGDSE